MGSVVGKVMEENFQKQQKFMEKNQEVMLERNIQMQNQMRERQMAMMIARSRDMFYWFGSFYFTTLGLGLVAAMKTKNPKPLIPAFPLTFIFGYQYDLAMGTKLERCVREADRILDDEQQLLALPHGLPTLATIEDGRARLHRDERFQAHDLFL